MFRIQLAMIIGGGVLAFFGGQEFLVSSGSGSDPLAVELAAVESGTEPESNYVAIGEHIALYGGCVYTYEQGKHDTSGPDNSTRVTECYYPIISHSHPFLEALDQLEEQVGEDGVIPDGLTMPTIDNFAVIVKTTQFNTIGEIPDDFVGETSIEGLVINQIESLDDEEIGLLQESFPLADFNTVLIVEAGREPASVLKSLGMMGGGGILALLGIGLFFVGRDD